MIIDKTWVFDDRNLEEEAKRLSSELGISKLLSRVLASRGATDTDEIKNFLNPDLMNMHHPFILKDMDQAVERICEAIENNESIVIFGDYDVDGVTSVSILYDFFMEQNIKVQYYIPDRIDEGYGLSIESIDKILETEPDLIITVDCGISSIEEVDYIIEKGSSVIITDHHECGKVLPNAYAVVNPHREDCPYPFKNLAGVGVVYKLIHALCIKLGLGDLHLKYMDLVAIGTIADVVPMVDENRVIASFGLKKIEQTHNLGIKALLDCTDLADKPINTGTVGFILAPRINAAGRTGDATRGVELFTTTDPNRALAISRELDRENANRQEIQAQIYSEALELIEKQIDVKTEKVIVLAKQGWHPGVIGIVASKVTEKYFRPCIIITEEDGVGKGSARSIDGFNMFEALTYCSDALIRYGGHELAAGLTIDISRLSEFKKMINDYANSILDANDLVPKLKIDVFVEKDEISLESVKELGKLAPVGMGNPAPMFAYRGLKIKHIRTLCEDKHIKMLVNDEELSVDAIGFNMGGIANRYRENDVVDLAFYLEVNTWNSAQKLQMNLKDIKLSEKEYGEHKYLLELDKSIEFKSLNEYNDYINILKSFKPMSQKEAKKRINELVPERMELAAVYKYISRAQKNNCLNIEDVFSFAHRIAGVYKVPMNFFKLKRSIEIFEELELLNKEQIGANGMLIRILNTGKTSLEKSKLYINLQNLKEDVFKKCN